MKNQTFGIEIETTGIGRERTAKAIAAHFGTTARHIGLHLDDWKVPMPDGRHWTVERDGSVTDPSAEVVSPVCRYEDIEMVQAVVRAIRAAGAKADRSCGIHIHIGLGEHTPQSLRRLVNIVNAKEDLLTMSLGISPARRSQWCAPVNQVFLTELNRRKPTTMEDFARIWYARSGGSAPIGGAARHSTTTTAGITCSTSTRPSLPSAPRTPSSSAPSTARSTRARSKPTSSCASPSAHRR